MLVKFYINIQKNLPIRFHTTKIAYSEVIINKNFSNDVIISNEYI